MRRRRSGNGSEVPRLRTVSPADPGWTRRRCGRGFVYLDQRGARLTSEDSARIRALAIPPAWTDVWICRFANGHLQAVGTDDAQRRQYLYHPSWRELRDRLKFDRVLEAAAELPRVRRRLARDLSDPEPSRVRALALAVRLLDLGYFRVGSDAYADEYGSFGLTTLRRDHVRATSTGLVFAFTGKSGVEHEITVTDADVVAAIQPLRQRRGGEPKLLAHREGRGWRGLDAADVNEYLDELFEGEFTAKDFRTWHATVLAAVALAESEEPGAGATSRRRAVKAAVAEVASYLGNTPAIAKGSYIDPRVLDLYESGTVVDLPARAPRTPSARQAAAERAVLDLLA